MEIGECKPCKCTKELMDSHIIPNVMFNRILKMNNGWAITFQDDEESWVERNSGSWSEFLLCSQCEGILNNNYENYSIAAIRNSLNSIEFKKNPKDITFKNIDLNKFQLFWASILWRSSVSTLEEYSKVKLPLTYEGEIRECIFNSKKIRTSLLDIRIFRIYDKTPNGFDMESIKSAIISPFCRTYNNQISFHFLLEGFYVVFLIPGYKIGNRAKQGLLKPTRNVLLVPFKDIFEIPEVVNLLTTAYRKHHNGKSKIK
jgi:hypothetical protein